MAGGRQHGCRSILTVVAFLGLVGTASSSSSAERGPVDADGGGCRALGHCCQGKNNTCRGIGPRANDANSSFCFCDSACIHIGDCCPDHRELCEPVDCVLADDWDAWGECSSRCGQGIKRRERKVVQPSLNGGKGCGSTVEKVVCEGTNCKIARAPEGHEELRETGKIVPAAFGSWRKNKMYNPYEDIRKNLFQHYEAKADDNRPSYCMKFEVTEVRGSCHKNADLWSMDLQKGSTACVECQPMAMKKKLGNRCKGHGVYLKETRWNAVTVPGCHGKWTLQTRPENCQCDADHKLSFVLV